MYPDSKMIGGSSTKKNMEGEKASTFLISSSGNIFISNPRKMTINIKKAFSQIELNIMFPVIHFIFIKISGNISQSF